MSTRLVAAVLVVVVIVAVNLPLVPALPLPADGASFALAAVRVGQPHLPYPVHTLLSVPFARLPWASPAWGVNVLSTIAAAATCATVYLFVVRHAPRIVPGADATRPITQAVAHIAGASAAVLLAVSLSFWQTSVVAEVYTLNALLILAPIALVTAWDRDGRTWQLVASALALFLSLGTNYLNLALVPIWLLVLVTSTHRSIALRPRAALGMVLALAIGLGQFAYVPLRPYGPPPDVASFERYWDFNLGPQVRNYLDFSLFGGAGAEGGGAEPVRFLGGYLAREFMIAVPFALLGGLRWWQRNPRTAWILSAVFLINRATVMLSIDDPRYVPDVGYLLIPSNVVFALAVGAGILAAYELASSKVSRAMGAAIGAVLVTATGILLVAVPAWVHLPSVSRYRGEAAESAEYSGRLLRAAEPGSVILTDWTFGTPLWFYQRADGLGDQVHVVSLWPDEYRRFMKSDGSDRVVYLTHQSPENLRGLEAEVFIQHGWMSAYRLASGPGE